MAITRDKKQTKTFQSNTSVLNSEALFNLLNDSKTKSLSYHEILFQAGLIDEVTFKVGSPLDSSLRNVIRKAWKGLSGKQVTKGIAESFKINNSKKSYVVISGGNSRVGESQISSKTLTLQEYKK